jgi:pectin methylesterase-like acyl-CoA thioesterase
VLGSFCKRFSIDENRGTVSRSGRVSRLLHAFEELTMNDGNLRTCAVCAAFCAQLAMGATLTVDDDGLADFASIQAALDAAADGDLILVAAGDYSETLSLGARSVVIRGDGFAKDVIVRSPSGARLLSISEGHGSALRFENLTFTGGSSDRLIYISGSSPVFEKCIFRGNARGAIYEAHPCSSTAGGTYRSCLFINNREPNGGAAYFLHANCTLENCAFIGNQAVGPTSGVNAGGAVYVNDWNCGTHEFRFTRCHFIDNYAVWGGAIYSQGTYPNSPTQMPLTNCVFVANTASQGKSMWNWYITAPVSGSWFCGGGDQIRNWWQDAGGNSFFDACSALPYADCDGDGLSDELEIALGYASDCDSDGVPDACAISRGSAIDANGDGVIDACDGVLEVPGEYATIQAAIDVAVDGQTVLVGPGTWAGFNMLGKRVEVRSNAGKDATLIDGTQCCGSAVRFGVGSGLGTRLIGFTLRAGMGTGEFWFANGGCIYIEQGNGTIEDCDFTGSVYGCGYGGGIRAISGSLVLRRCRFLGTSAIHDGGGINLSIYESLEAEPITGENPEVRAVIEDCVAIGCYGYNAGGFAVSIQDDQQEHSIINVRRCFLTNNTGEYGPSSYFPADMRVGGVSAEPASHEIRISDCVFASGSLSVSSGIRWQPPVSLRARFDRCAFVNGFVRRNIGSIAIGNSWFCATGVGVYGGYSDLGGNTANCPPIEDCDEDGVRDFYEIVLRQEEDLNGDARLDSCGFIRVPEDFVTIQAAIDSVDQASSALIRVGPGVFAGGFSLAGKDVVIEGAASGATVIMGTDAGDELAGPVVRFAGGEPATAGIRDLVIRNAHGGEPYGYERYGGGLFASNSAAFVDRCRFEGCRSDVGAAAAFIDCTIDISDSVFVDGTATIHGGGLALYRASGVIRNSNFESNLSGFQGGSGSAVFIEGTSGDLDLTGCSVRWNAAAISGSAVEIVEGSTHLGLVRLEDCDISFNSAEGGTGLVGVDAGGLRVYATGTACVLRGATRVCGNEPRNVDGPYIIDEGGGGAVEVCDPVGDIIEDGFVDGADMAALLAVWGASDGASPADLNHDGIVGGVDLTMLLNSWGAVASSGSKD